MSQTSKKTTVVWKKLSIKAFGVFNEKVMKSCLQLSRAEISNFFIKAYWIQHIFEAEHHLLIKTFCTSWGDHRRTKNLITIFGSYKRIKGKVIKGNL